MRVSVKMEQTVNQLAIKHGVDLTQPYAFMKLQLSYYMPVVVYRSEENKVSVMHVNSDYMADPEIVFWTGSTTGWMPIEVTQLVGGHRVYATANETGTAVVPISHRRQASITQFAETWANNIADQGWLQGSEKAPDLFPLGQLVATPGALAVLASAHLSPLTLVNRHVRGDWGELDEHDVQENERALRQGSRIFSSYPTPQGTRLWVITECDRSATTLLLPSEY